MSKKEYDFAGYATKAGVRCSDGVTIGKNAFKDQDGTTVPLVWNHNHKDAEDVLGHALLENREDGVYAYCKFNGTPKGVLAKELVHNGDIRSLSIWANKLQKTKDNVVAHGMIRELSLVLAGANPEAFITTIAHGDAEFNENDFEAEIQMHDEIVIHSEIEEDEEIQEESTENVDENVSHADETIEDVLNTLDPKQKLAAFIWITATLNAENIEIDDDSNETLNAMYQTLLADENIEMSDDETIQDIVDTFDEKQRNAVELLIGLIIDEENPDEDVQQSDDLENQNTENLSHNEEEISMKNNVFDQNNENLEENVLSHDEFETIMREAKTNGSVRDAFLAHSITDVENLFPEAKLANGQPATIKEEDEWVSTVMNAVHKSPFSRIKTMAIDITGDNARAKGYVKGAQKVEEVISALKRTTTPQTVYKLQKMDRDDVLDITDFDVIAYLKNEMRIMLNKELARAVLTGDGRSASSPDKVNPINIRPILGDNATYVTAKVVVDGADYLKNFIVSVRKARKDYKGSGRPTLFIDDTLLDDLLLIEDKNGRFIYETEEQLAKTLRVSKIVPVSYFNTVVRENDEQTKDYTCQAIMVNLADYTMGADKGGAVTMFEDFDINFNKQEYLIETRVSGALTVPFSAVTFEKETTKASA